MTIGFAKVRHAGALAFIVFAFSYGTSAYAQPADQADAAYAEAMDAASDAYAQTRKVELTKWVAAQEKALVSAKSAGDQEGIDYLTEMIGRSKRAGYVVEPLPKDAVKLGGNDYALIEEAAPWHVAKRQCERMGGHLVTIETKEEEAFLLERFGKSRFWIGAGDPGKEGIYVWLTGRPFKPFGQKWEFQNTKGVEHCLYWETSGKSAHWSDGSEVIPLPFVCEWER